MQSFILPIVECEVVSFQYYNSVSLHSCITSLCCKKRKQKNRLNLKSENVSIVIK